MSIKILANQLQREAAANKGKAAALAAVCAVALYFWAPLVFSWFGDDNKSQPSPLVVTANATTSPDVIAPSPAAVPAKPGSSHAWYDVAEWIKHDPRMGSATLPEGLTNPFEQPKPAVKQDNQDELAKTKTSDPPPRLDLQQLGMKLTSTMVGRSRAVIQINGKTKRVPIDSRGHPTESTTVEFNSAGSIYRFDVIRVAAGGVLLRRDKEIYELQVKQRQIAGNDFGQFLGSNP